jgi:hypothetical protein
MTLSFREPETKVTVTVDVCNAGVVVDVTAAAATAAAAAVDGVHLDDFDFDVTFCRATIELDRTGFDPETADSLSPPLTLLDFLTYDILATVIGTRRGDTEETAICLLDDNSDDV